MSDLPVVYVFRHANFSPTADTAVCAAPLDLVVSVYGGGGIHDSEGLSAAFGGAALFRDEDTGTCLLGVWGKRNAARFRTGLRAHRELRIVYDAPRARLVWYGIKNL